MNKRINLNADLGESFGPWKMGEDEALLQVVASANIACGFHAGDPLVMRRTVRTALDAGVSLGAHPAWPDLQGFGRRQMKMAPAELEAMVIYQIGALAGIAAAEGSRVTHVKPHGALNNQACEDAALADAIARAVKAADAALILLAPALSELHKAGERAGLRVAAEIFADRAYTDAGTLVPRGQPGAVIHDHDALTAHVLRMLDAGGIVTVGGRTLPCRMDSICVHGDTPGAVDSARQLRAALQAAGWQVVPLPEVLDL
ncbi:5-oxoprolinase subunit PxpA [Thauera sp. CAU 1555]|uniref:5-oxoprolinase subunit A n=1 Tax=Thauera sedimentorum TaxID=2767595 RepID=A0ABR9B6Z0_9RHOO|nr:5-oxoprolinase subunit PxpA [Thauera sedimentorum]MBC9071222.1 5-oxoprolinase subunit PxpA [Thauera sedimentorum]MBD8502141.1 5-oxoprolinase subunit PxpA [Thauera sedimentorum]